MGSGSASPRAVDGRRKWVVAAIFRRPCSGVCHLRFVLYEVVVSIFCSCRRAVACRELRPGRQACARPATRTTTYEGGGRPRQPPDQEAAASLRRVDAGRRHNLRAVASGSLDRVSAVHWAWHPPSMWIYLAAAIGLVAALSLPVVVAARSLALAATTRADHAHDELGPERRARLQRYVAR
jgi:hypothetical protein